MTIQPSFDDLDAWLGAKPGGSYVIERWGNGWAVSIHRAGLPVETRLTQSRGEANRIGLELSAEGLCGFVTGGA